MIEDSTTILANNKQTQGKDRTTTEKPQTAKTDNSQKAKRWYPAEDTPQPRKVPADTSRNANPSFTD